MKKGKRISFLVIAVLMVAFLVISSTDLLINEDGEVVKKISVFAVTDGNLYLEDFKRGILESAGESRVDVNYVTVSEAETEEEIIGHLRREYDSEVEAIILFMENPEVVREYLREKEDEIPVITVDMVEKEGYRADISIDGQSCAEELSEEIRREHGSGVRTVFLTGKEKISEDIGGILQQAFQEKGMTAECVELSQENIRKCRESEEETVYVGCWMAETEQAAEYLEREALYGVGYSNQILGKMLNGEVAGVAAFSMYEAGIYATQQAVRRIEKKKTEPVQISCRMIVKENMKEQQEFLFPVY